MHHVHAPTSTHITHLWASLSRAVGALEHGVIEVVDVTHSSLPDLLLFNLYNLIVLQFFSIDMLQE